MKKIWVIFFITPSLFGGDSWYTPPSTPSTPPTPSNTSSDTNNTDVGGSGNNYSYVTQRINTGCSGADALQCCLNLASKACPSSSGNIDCPNYLNPNFSNNICLTTQSNGKRVPLTSAQRAACLQNYLNFAAQSKAKFSTIGCLNTLSEQEMKTAQQVESWQYKVEQIQALKQQLSALTNTANIICSSCDGKDNEAACAQNEFYCSPTGIAQTFENTFFKDDLTGLMSDPYGMPTSFFGNCPGMFFYLCNAMEQQTAGSCLTLTGQYAVQVNGTNMSFYDFIKNRPAGTVTDSTGKNVNPHYNWFSQSFPEEFYSWVILPFILIAQQGDRVRTTIMNQDTLAAMFASLIDNIDLESYMGAALTDNLKAQLKTDFPNGFALCPGYAGWTECPLNKANPFSLFPCNSFFTGLGCAITVGGESKNTLCTHYQDVSEDLYDRLLTCCINPKAGSTIPVISAAFLCDFLSKQEAILTSLLGQKQATFSADAFNDFDSTVKTGCLGKNKNMQIVNSCMKQNVQTAFNSCITSKNCTSGNDTSSTCESCIKTQLNNICITNSSAQNGISSSDAAKAVSDFKACIDSSKQSSPIDNIFTLIANSLNSMAIAQIDYANLIQKYALSSNTLPPLCSTSSSDSSCVCTSSSCNCILTGDTSCLSTCGCLEQKNLKLGDKSFPYYVVTNWDQNSQSYKDAMSFTIKMLNATYPGTCPVNVTGQEIAMDVLGIFFDVIGAAMVYTSPVPLLMAIQQYALTVPTTILNNIASSIMAMVTLESEEEQVNT